MRLDNRQHEGASRAGHEYADKDEDEPAPRVATGALAIGMVGPCLALAAALPVAWGRRRSRSGPPTALSEARSLLWPSWETPVDVVADDQVGTIVTVRPRVEMSIVEIGAIAAGEPPADDHVLLVPLA